MSQEIGATKMTVIDKAAALVRPAISRRERRALRRDGILEAAVVMVTETNSIRLEDYTPSQWGDGTLLKLLLDHLDEIVAAIIAIMEAISKLF